MSATLAAPRAASRERVETLFTPHGPVVLVSGEVGEETAGPLRWPLRRRRQRAAGRRVAARALSHLTGLDEGRFRVVGDPGQAPRVTLDARAAPGLRVSIAHSGDRAMAAVARSPVGLDLEGPIERGWLDEIAFDARVRSRISAAPQKARPQLRAEAWCTLEAVGKLRGVGLSAPFAELALGPALARETGRLESGETWVLVVGPLEREPA